MLTVEEARQRMLDTITTLPTEKRGILDSLGTILAEDVYASENIPPFHNSAMDGFAVVAEDVSHASEAAAGPAFNHRDDSSGLCANSPRPTRKCCAYHDRRDDA